MEQGGGRVSGRRTSRGGKRSDPWSRRESLRERAARNRSKRRRVAREQPARQSAMDEGTRHRLPPFWPGVGGARTTPRTNSKRRPAERKGGELRATSRNSRRRAGRKRWPTKRQWARRAGDRLSGQTAETMDSRLSALDRSSRRLVAIGHGLGGWERASRRALGKQGFLGRRAVARDFRWHLWDFGLWRGKT